MFSSLSSFLPSALTAPLTQPPPNPQHPLNADMHHPEAAKRKKDRTNESFIVVRPPPSKTNHPLNLQVQLVPPTTRENQRPGSSASSGDTDSVFTPLSRTGSNRSDTSMYSNYSTTPSMASSASSASSGRRMIIPLYNLQAHNVMQNVIVDAGTDAKVAKFLRRGLEVIGLAVLEPVEVWGAPRDSWDLATAPASASTAAPHTPEGSVLSLPASGLDHAPAPIPVPAPAPMPEVRSPPKKLFGKIFKRRDAPSPPPPPLSLSPPSPAQSKRGSLLVDAAPATPAPILQPPVLGIQPLLSSPSLPPRGRPSQYVWVVRRWLKTAQGPETLLGGVRDMLGAAGAGPGAGGMEVEVRFEWSRGKGKGRKRGRRHEGEGEASRERGKRSSLAISSATASLQHHAQAQGAGRAGSAARHSLDSRRSVSPTRAPSVATNTTSTEDAEDGGDDSDPEDSETPWTCTLVVRRAVPHAHADAGAVVRVKVAGVIPTPHHPKVVALLKVPFPLPDVAVDQVQLRRRVITPAGLARPASPPAPAQHPPLSTGSSGSPGKAKGFWNGGGGGRGSPTEREGLMLSAEEIKDVVSSTALWLVVREGFGGVGRVSRKGDGWRIRG